MKENQFINQKKDILNLRKSTKLCIIGDSNVGKTSIIKRYVDNSFGQTEPSIGACNHKRVVKLSSGEEMDLEIWDTAGQERFKSIVPMYYKGSKGIIIVFDITNTASFDGAKTWVKDLSSHNNTAILSLVGNKCDLSDIRTVSFENAKIFANQNNLLYFETSAKEGSNVTEIFFTIAEKIPRNKDTTGAKGLKVDEVTMKQRKNNYCCNN
jgi:small GTP-binding protein